MRAASTRSGETLLKNERITRMLKTEMAPGRICDQYSPYPPRLETTRKVGIRPPLKNMVTMRKKRMGRWAKVCARDRPYAHSTLAAIETAVPTVVMPRLTTSEWSTNWLPKICR
jgi:hypothetical protein